MSDAQDRAPGQAAREQALGGDAEAGAGAQAELSEEELRAAYEAELNRITSAEMIVQTTVSLLNLGGRRLGLGGASGAERDLEQVRDAIDAVRGLMPVLERRMPQELGPLRDALAQLQMAFAREAAAKPGEKPTEPKPTEPKEPEAEKRGPAQASGRLWVPGQ